MSDLDRQELKHRVCRQHTRYISEIRAVGIICPWCKEQVEGGWHLHEWYVKRSAVPVDKQYLIMVPVNCVPVHPNDECHNQSKEMTRRCLSHIVPHIYRADQVGGWYVSLWREYGLSVPKGLLLPQKDVPMTIAYRLFKRGAAALGLTDWEPHGGQDISALAILKWQGKRLKRSSGSGLTTWRHIEWGKYGLGGLLEAIDTGYWLDYLEGLIGGH